MLHLILATLLVYHEQLKIWPDLKNTPPADESEVAQPIQMDSSWNPCYEYRATVAHRFVLVVQFPVGILLGLDGNFRGCRPGLLSPVLRKLRMGAKTGTIFLDVLLALGIAGQWWLIGWRIDTLRKSTRQPWLWMVPAIAISIAGCLMVPAGIGATNLFELTAFLAATVGLLAWIFLLVTSLVVGIKWVFQWRESARTA